MLIDQYQRQIKKIRVSLTDKCNLRCLYCMPEDQTFLSDKYLLKSEEYFPILNELYDLGVEEIRLTGGEPLLRKEAREILYSLASIPFKKKAITTNGLLLNEYLEDLKLAGFTFINISLDTFSEDTFFQISRRRGVQKVIDNILLAKAMGFVVKINVVVMKGINDHEIHDFVSFAQIHQIEVRFLELMKIGFANKMEDQHYLSAREVQKKLQEKYELTYLPREKSSTAYQVKLSNSALIGFISSESEPFCADCSRWRLTAQGILMSCLFKEEGLSLKDTSAQERAQIYQEVLKMKPIQRGVFVQHAMHELGG